MLLAVVMIVAVRLEVMLTVTMHLTQTILLSHKVWRWNLASDDPVYVSVNSSDQENGELIVKPYRMIVNPSEGAAEFNVMLKDNGLASQPSLKVSITTSGNRLMEQEIAVAFEE